MKSIISVKSLSFLLVVLLSGISIFAQDVPLKATKIVTGTVLDKEGNPVGAAELSSRGWPEVKHASDDGSFSIEVPYWLETLTASSEGFKSSTVKLKDSQPVVITLKIKKKNLGFVDVLGGAVWPIKNEPAGVVTNGGIPQFGVMGGIYRTWGAYFKLVCATSGVKVPSGLTDQSQKYDATPTVTIGVLRRISDNLNIFAGTGLAVNYSSASSVNEYFKYDANKNLIGMVSSDFVYGASKQALAMPIEAGVMWKFTKRFNAIAGLIYCFPAFSGSVTSNDVERPEQNDGSYIVDSYKKYNAKNSGNMGFYVGVGVNF
ncbi:MAG: carboxypeptidase-like regulatory domain-containing protein [Muribaculaceae bacterium]|nr:carboxypeptidase-like regulatory domain-containing protein [Muribaculaceae bacterium]